jgi:integrase
VASITKTQTSKGTRYRVRWRVEGRPVERWAETLKAAQAIATTAENDALTGAPIDPQAGARTLADYFAEWIEARMVQGRPLTPSTRVGYERLWRRNIADTLGRRELRAVRPETVRAWHAEVTAAAGTDQAAKSYRVLRAVMATAESDELIRSNPCRIRGAAQERADERPMIETAVALELADAIAQRYRAMVLLAAFGGLRTGEALGLRRRDINPLRGTVRVERQAQEVGGRIELGPKSEAGRRNVALPAPVLEALVAHLERFTRPEPAAVVFTGPEGGPLRRATLSAAWRAAVATVGAPAGLRLHDLRHHAATLVAQTGATTRELMATIGHSSPRAALIYQHATEERSRTIADKLGDVIEAARRVTDC